jgi:hypothetical protein
MRRATNSAMTRHGSLQSRRKPHTVQVILHWRLDDAAAAEPAERRRRAHRAQVLPRHRAARRARTGAGGLWPRADRRPHRVRERPSDVDELARKEARLIQPGQKDAVAFGQSGSSSSRSSSIQASTPSAESINSPVKWRATKTKQYQSSSGRKAGKVRMPRSSGARIASPLSSYTSRAAHASGVSPGSSLPPNPFHLPWCMSCGALDPVQHQGLARAFHIDERGKLQHACVCLAVRVDPSRWSGCGQRRRSHPE